MGVQKVSEERPGSEEDEETEAENKGTAEKKNISLKKMVLLMCEKLSYICQHHCKACCRHHCFGLAQVRPTSSNLTKLGSKLCCTCTCGESISRAENEAQHPNTIPPFLHSLVQNFSSSSENTVKVNVFKTSQEKKKKTMQKCSK